MSARDGPPATTGLTSAEQLLLLELQAKAEAAVEQACLDAEQARYDAMDLASLVDELYKRRDRSHT